jgi:hypothetical protein
MFCRKSKLLGLEALARESPSQIRHVEDEYTQKSILTHRAKLYNNHLSKFRFAQNSIGVIGRTILLFLCTTIPADSLLMNTSPPTLPVGSWERLSR